MDLEDPRLEGLFCDACGRDANDVVDEDFFLPTDLAMAQGYLSGRCQRHPPEEPEHFERIHVGGGEGLGEA
jgi:hypothetical protein